MRTCRGGISLWDHWNSTFCLLTWWKGSSSVLSSASQQRPQSLWDQHFIHMKDLMPLIQYFCLSRMMTPKQRSLWSHCLSSFHVWAWYTESCPSGIYLLSGKGAKRHRLAQGHTTEVSPTLHSALFIAPGFRVHFQPWFLLLCDNPVFNLKKKKKLQRPHNTVKQKLENVQLGTKIANKNLCDV